MREPAFTTRAAGEDPAVTCAPRRGRRWQASRRSQTSCCTDPGIPEDVSRNPDYELTLTGTFLPAFSPTGDRFVTNSRPSPDPLGATLFMTTTTAAEGGVERIPHAAAATALRNAECSAGLYFSATRSSRPMT